MTATPPSPIMMISMILPGASRKRLPAPYHYRATYRNPIPTEPGCVATWSVAGGREEYQIALERADSGELIWHCTCPDAIYRADQRQGCGCKHVQGLAQVAESVGHATSRSAA